MSIGKKDIPPSTLDEEDLPASEQTDSVVALSYDPENKEGAPSIIANAQGELADKILQIAKDSNIPIHKDPDLLALLKASDVGEEIPLEAFIAVAEILRFIYEQNGTEISSS